MRTLSRRIILESVLISALSLLIVVRALAGLHDGDAFIDLRPMYCAGAAVLEHADPYAVEPLRSCEIARGLNPPSGVMPAPVPGYVLAPFAVLARLPYEIVLISWIIAALGALIAIVMLTARLAGLSALAPMLLLFWPVGYFPINLGQLSIVGTLGIVLAAFAAQRRRWRLAAVGAMLALVQPQLGLPIIVVSALFFTKARKALLVGVVVLVVLSVATVGANGTLRYLTVELPRHAASEAHWPYQMSLTWILAYNRASESVAVTAGSLSTLVLLAIAVYVAWRFHRAGMDDVAILSAGGCGALFGSFIHGQQMESILPLAIVLTARARFAAFVPAFATVLLSVAWAPIAGSVLKRGETILQNVGVLVGIFVNLTTRSSERRQAIPAFAGAVTIAAVLCVWAWFLPAFDPPPHLSPAATARITASGPLASDQWKTFADLSYRGKHIGEQLIAWKIYSWLGVMLVLAYSFAAAVRPAILAMPTVGDSHTFPPSAGGAFAPSAAIPTFGGLPNQ